MAFTKAQLQAELNSDPKALGYAPFRTAGNYQGLAALVNGTYPGVGVVWRTDVRGAEVLGALVWSEIASLSSNNWLALQSLLIPSTPIDANNARIRGIFTGLFPVATFPGTSANLTSTGQKASPSRAEELWGYATYVTEQDVANAINP
jgi:hypothetical protein